MTNEPIEYKKFKDKFNYVHFCWNENNAIGRKSAQQQRNKVLAFIKANFIPKSEIDGAISKSFKIYKNKIKDGFVSVEIIDKDFVDGYNQALSDLKSILKLDNE